jgi:hypothetical protein
MRELEIVNLRYLSAENIGLFVIVLRNVFAIDCWSKVLIGIAKHSSPVAH